MSTAAAPFERRKVPRAVRRQRLLISVAENSLLIAASIAFLAPVVFITLTALMTTNQALSPVLWPETFEWRNFA
jgi:multiple sugar transport system permease protein